MLLVAASLVIGAILTTITAATFASYAKGNKNDVVVEDQLTDVATKNIATEVSFSVSR